MNYLTSFKANPVCDADPVAPLMIVFEEPLPESPKEGFEQFWRDLYASEARKIVDALNKSLPGGLVSAILVALMDDARNVLAITSRKATG